MQLLKLQQRYINNITEMQTATATVPVEHTTLIDGNNNGPKVPNGIDKISADQNMRNSMIIDSNRVIKMPWVGWGGTYGYKLKVVCH